MSSAKEIEKILGDKDYQVDYSKMHLSFDDLVVIKHLFNEQDKYHALEREELMKAIAETLSPFYNAFEKINKELGEIKTKVYVDHEERILRLERQMLVKRVKLFAMGAVATAAVIMLTLYIF